MSIVIPGTGPTSGERQTPYPPALRLSDFQPEVRHDEPVNEFLDHLVTERDVVWATLKLKNQPSIPLERSRPEFSYWLFYGLLRDDMPMPTSQVYPKLHAATEDDRRSQLGPQFYMPPTPIRVELPLTGPIAAPDRGRRLSNCRELVHGDLLHRSHDSPIIQELMGVIGRQALLRASFASAPLLSGVEYRFRDETIGWPTMLSARLFFTHHFLAASSIVNRVFERKLEQKKQDPYTTHIPDWMPDAALPNNQSHVAKKLALSLLAGQVRRIEQGVLLSR